MTSHLFVTGSPRSGTTLLDKLLSAHPQARVFSQPLPLMYVRLKEAFLEFRGATVPCEGRYPLNDMVGPTYYPPEDFRRYLAARELTLGFCRQTLEEMIPFSGQYTKPTDPLGCLSAYRPKSFYAFVRDYCQSLVSGSLPRIIGWKESFCEEYIPYFLSCNTRVLLILRDPRDVLTSLDYGRGREFGGRRRPILFNLRQWRKSVAFALAHEGESSFLAVRYEDLVSDPGVITDRIADFLGVDRFTPEVLAGNLLAESGELWRSNSSHRSVTRISADSLGSYREHMPRETDLFVQAVCFAELKYLGYQLEITSDEVLPMLEGYRETDRLERSELGYYAWCEERRQEEERRWLRLRNGKLDPTWSIFEQASARLSRRLANPVPS